MRLYADLPSRQAAQFQVGGGVSVRVDTADVRCFPIKD